jgi:Putative zinc-finger
MSCEERQDALQELLAGELAGEHRLALEEHLRHCSACREDLAAYRLLFDALPRVPDVPVPAGLHHQVMTSLRTLQPAWKQRETPTEMAARRAVAVFLALAFGVSFSLAQLQWMGRIVDVVTSRVSMDLLSLWHMARDLWGTVTLLGTVWRALQPAGQGVAEGLRRSAQPIATGGPVLLTVYTAALCLGAWLCWRAFRHGNEREFEHAR